MGIIYKITSPSNKVYIGQTIKTVEKRWKEHIEDALNPKKDHCKALNLAIRKYGVNNFKFEIIIECGKEMLDEYEIKYITQCSSQTPNGYNIKLGGSSGLHSEDTKLKISETLKGRIVQDSTKVKMMLSKKNNIALPMYVLECKSENIVIGYRVCNHQLGSEKRFLSKNETLQFKLQRAINYLDELNNRSSRVSVSPRTLPKYIQKNGIGYAVKYPNTKCKYFVSKSISNQDNFCKALSYLNSISHS